MAQMTSVLTALAPAMTQVLRIVEARQAARLRQEMAARDRDLTRYGQGVEMAALRRRQDVEEALLKSDVDQQLAELTQTANTEEKRRRSALRRAMARTRAGLGARGITAGGSGEALLLGLVSETGEERRQAADLDRLRSGALNRQLDDRRRRNLLEIAELAERQRLERLSKGY